jgi:hypothetical protein
MQSPWKEDWHLHRWFQMVYLHANEKHEGPRHCHVLLWMMHSDGNAVWAQIQISLQWRSSPTWGRQDTSRPGSVQVQVQRKVKCWFLVSLVFFDVGQIPIGNSSFQFLCLTIGVSELEKFVFTRWFPDLHVKWLSQTQKDKDGVFTLISII